MLYIVSVFTAVAAGAHMGFSAGWEVPLWYSAPGSAPSYQPSFFRTNWQREQVAAYLQYLQYLNISSSRAENTSCSPPPWPWPTSPGLYLSISTTRNVFTSFSLSTPVSSFGKFSLTGPDSAQLLDVATAGAVPRPGRTVLCHMLTQGGKVTTLTIWISLTPALSCCRCTPS